MEGPNGSMTDGGPGHAIAKWRSEVSRKFQYYLDKSTPHVTGRWLGTLSVALIYALRVYIVQGFYIVSYGLGIYLLNLLIGFLSPMVDPELEVPDGPSLPTKGSDEFKPFIRRLPEFKFWYEQVNLLLYHFFFFLNLNLILLSYVCLLKQVCNNKGICDSICDDILLSF